MQRSGLRVLSLSSAFVCLWSSLLVGQQAQLAPFAPSLWQALQEQEAFRQGQEALPVFPPSDAVVPAEHYRLGPGDVLLLQVRGALVQTHRLVVSATGDIVLPRVGLLSVQGMTLAQARQVVERAMQQHNPAVQSDLQLLFPRRVVVTVTGYVRAPGTYVVPATMRVSTVVWLAMQGNPSGQVATGRQTGGVSEVVSLRQLEQQWWERSSIPPLPSYCTRRVLLRFPEGNVQVADVEWGQAMGDGQANPMVSEGLHILVPSPPPEGYPTVSIAGAVRSPVRVAYREGDRLSFLLRLAGGIEPSRAEPVAIVYVPGQSERRVELDTAGMPREDIELLPGSAVLVPERAQAGLGRWGIVTVVGAVVRPGSYVIEPGRTRLRELIERAGGFTPKAALAQAYVQRRQAGEYDLADPRLPAELSLYRRFVYSDLRLEDTVRYALDVRLQRSLVSCDFVALFRRGEERYNVPLYDGDLVVVPEAAEGVFVWGQVRSPGVVPFEPGRTVQWYIAQAGGYGVGADQQRVRVLRGATRTWLLPKEAGELQPGDEIYVPRRLDVPAWAAQQAELQLYTVLVGAVSTLTFIVTTIVNLLRR